MISHEPKAISQRQPISLLVGLVALLTIMALPAHTSAASQSFSILSGQPQTGMLMSLTKNPDVVEPADKTNLSSLVGVINPNDTNLDQQPGQIDVETDGLANALVSTLGGNILVGDRITASSLEGIGEKTTSRGWIVGLAQASLDPQTRGAIRSTITDTNGVKHVVYLALMPILVHVTYYNSAVSSSSEGSVVPSAIQNFANSLAGKHVSTRALVFSFLLFIIGVIISGTIVNSAIRSGYLAISRQPLSKFVILREEKRSFLIALAVLVFVIVSSILMLRLL